MIEQSTNTEQPVDDNIGEAEAVFQATAQPTGAYKDFNEFSSAMTSNKEEAMAFYSSEIQPTGAYKDFDEFVAIFKQQPTAKAQPPVYKPDNTKRYTKEEAALLVDKYLPGMGVTTARETAINAMTGKTELELTRQFPQLGKRLAEVQKKSAAPGTTTSPSSGAQSVLPSLAEQAERESVFGRYEQLQGQTVGLQKKKQQLDDTEIGRFGTRGIEQEKAAIRKQTDTEFRASKLESDKARKEAFDKIKPILEKDFSDEKNLEKFIRTNESGIKTADPYFIDEYAKEFARSYKQPEDGYFKEAIYNEATKLASFKAIEPDVLKKYEERKKNIIKKYEAKVQQDFDKNFTTDEIEQQKLDGQVKLLSERLKSEYKFEEDKLIEGLKGASSQFDADYLSATQILKQQAEEINRLANEGAMPPNEAQARMAALEQEQEKIYSTYVAAKDESFNTYLSQANQLSSKYNTRLKRQAEEFTDIAKRSVEKAKEEFLEKSGGNAEMAKELELAYKMAYNEVIKEKEAQIQGQYAAGFFQYGGDQLGLGILSQFSEAFQTSLGGSLKGLGTTIDSNWLQRYGDYLSTKYSLPQAKTEEFSDLFDVQNMTQLSGQLAGSMTTSMAATVAAGALTGGAGLAVLPRLAITGFTGWMAESADMAGRMYDDTFRQTGDVALASQRAEQMWDAQVKLMPLYAFEGLPFIGSAVKRLPFIERVVAGAGIEFTSELAQESFQNVAEKNISAGNEAFDNALNMAMDNLKETAITIAPVAFLGAAGNLNREASPQEKLDAMAKGYAQKVAASDILNKGNAATDTWVSRMVASMGGIDFATTTINTLFANGTITEEQKVQMEQSALQANQNIQNAKASGLSTSEAIVYDAMAKKINSLNAELAAAKESGDVANQKLISANLKTAEQLLDTFAKTKAGDFATVEFADGSFVVMTDLSFMQEPDAAEKLKGTRVQVYSENGAQLLTEYSAKAMELVAPENVSLTNEVNITQAAEQQQQTPTENPALANVEATAKALEGMDAKVIMGKTKTFDIKGINNFFHASSQKRKGRLLKSNAPQFGTGVYFSTNKDLVKDEFGENVTNVVLNISKPVYTNTKQWQEVIKKAIQMADLDYGKRNNLTLDEGESFFRYDSDLLSEIDEIPSKFISDAAQELGYDAIIDTNSSAYENEIAVLDDSKIIYEEDVPSFISSLYHKAKQDGSNPELVQAIENLLTPNTNESVQQNNQNVQGGQADGQGNNQGQDVTQDGQEDGRQEGLLTEQPTAAQEGVASPDAGVDLDAQIKVAKEKLAEVKRKAAQTRQRMGIIPNPEEQGFRDREVIDAYIEIGKLYFKKGVRSVEDFARELGETVSDAMKQAWEAVVSEGGSFDMGGPPAIIPPTNAPNMGGRPAGEPGRVRAVYERVAKKMEERGDPQVQIDMVREKGTYRPQSRQETWDFAAALIEEMGGNYDAALMVASSIETGEFNYEIVKAILAIQQNKLWEKSKSAEGLTLDEVNQFSTRIDQIAKASTSEGRSMDLNKDIYHSNPDLFYYDQVDSKISEKNKSKMSTEDRAATRKAAQKARKVRTDAFSLMSEVLAGRVSLEALYTPGNKYYLSDAKLRNLLSVLVTFGQSLDGIDPEAKNILKAIFQQTEAFGNDVPLSKIRELIAANLNDLNGRVPVPFPIEQLQQVEAAMMDLFMELLSSEWNKTFDGRSKSFGEWVYSGKIRKDAVSLLAGAIGGLFPFEKILDPKSKYYVSDNKLRDIIRRAVDLGLNFSLKEAIKKIQQKELTIEEVEQLIENEIRNNNGGLPVPLGDSDLAELIKQIKWTFRSEAYDYIIKNSKEPKPFVSKRDIFNQLANVVSGKSDAAILFSFGDLTQRMQRGLAKLLSVIGTEAGPVSDVAFVSLRALLKSGNFGNMSNPRSNEFVPTKGRSKVQAAVEAIQRNNATQAILDFLSDPRVNGVTSGPQFKDVLDEYVAGLDEASIKAIEEGMLWLYNDFVVKNPGYKPGNKSGLSQILDRLRESGIWSMDVTRAEVENIVRVELANLNPSLQTPMNTQEIQDVAAAILDIYEEMVEKRLTELLQKEMPKRYTKALQVQLPKVVKSIMYGALELDETNPAKSDVVMNKFAPYFGGINPNLFTDQQKATLRQMAKNVVASAKAGGMNYQIQLQSFNRTLNSIIAQNSPFYKRIPYQLELFGAYLSAFIFENILFSIGTIVRTFLGNIGRVFMKGMGALMKGDFDIISDAWKRVAFTQKIENVELIDGAGNSVFTDVELNRTINGAYSAVRGNPKAAEAKTKGLSNIELEIRMMDSRIARIAARLSLTLAQRTLTASDAASTPLAAHVTKAQIFYEYIKNAYEAAGIPYTRYEITQQVNEILQPTPDAFSKALQQAYQETIQSDLFKKAGIPFPFTKPSKSEFSTMSVKAKIYNEWLMRTYAIIDSNEAQRAQQIAFNAGYLGSLDILNDVQKIDDFVAKVVSEMTFLGTPRGSFGAPAQFVNNFNSKLPMLKYTNITPMFANAAFNSMALFAKMAPGLNAAQLIKYAITGRRGRWPGAKGEEIDVNAIKKIDKQDMITLVTSTSILTAGVLSALSILRGDDDDERRKIFDGKGTFFTPVRLPDWLKALGYKPGTLYVNGEEFYTYRDGAFVGFFAPVAYMDAIILGINTNPMAERPMFDKDPEFIKASGMYTMHLFQTLVDNSMLRPTVDMAYDITKAIIGTPDPTEGDATKTQRVANVLKRNFASIPKNLVPKGRLLGEIKNISDAVSGEPEKVTKPDDFFNFLATGTAFEDWVDVSNRTDWFGRPVPETMKVPIINGMYSFFFEGEKHKDPYVSLFLEKNYVPKSVPSEKMAFEVSEEKIGTDAFNDAEKKYKALVENESDDREVGVNESAAVISMYESGFRRMPVTMTMTAKETYYIHEKKGLFVLNVLRLGDNMEKFASLEPEVFEKAMNKLYSIGRYSAMINGAKNGLFKGALDDEGLQVLIGQYKNQLTDFAKTYGVKSDIVIDNFMLYQFDNTRLPD